MCQYEVGKRAFCRNLSYRICSSEEDSIRSWYQIEGLVGIKYKALALRDTFLRERRRFEVRRRCFLS